MAVAIPASCSHDEPSNESPIPVPSVPTVTDTTAPAIDLKMGSIDIIGVEQILISGSELYVGDKLVAKWTDDVTKNCTVKVTFDGSTVASGDVAKRSGTLTLTVTDEAGNASSVIVRLVLDEVFPNLTVVKSEVNIFDGGNVELGDSMLLIDGDTVASWSDKYTAACKVVVRYNGQEVNSGDVLNGDGRLTVTVTNAQEKSSTAKITLTSAAMNGLKSLGTLPLQVDNEVNLFSGVDLADGVELVGTEIVVDGEREEIADPSHYVPQYP